MTTRTFVDCEGSVRAFLQGQIAVTTAAPGGVHIGTPTTVPSGAWVSLFLVSDVPEPGGGAPWTHAMVQFDCYAPIRKDAAALAYALVTALESLLSGALLDTHLRCVGGVRVTRTGFMPDPATPRRSRYSVDAIFDLIATGI